MFGHDSKGDEVLPAFLILPSIVVSLTFTAYLYASNKNIFLALPLSVFVWDKI
jgi:hypothetical protein